MKTITAIMKLFMPTDAIRHLGVSKEQQIKIAIKELRTLSDRELNDLGIARGDIEHAVRFGRRGIDNVTTHA